MRNLLAALAFSVVVGLLVYSAQQGIADPPPPPVAESPIPKIEQRRWQALAPPSRPHSSTSSSRDLFGAR